MPTGVSREEIPDFNELRPATAATVSVHEDGESFPSECALYVEASKRLLKLISYLTLTFYSYFVTSYNRSSDQVYHPKPLSTVDDISDSSPRPWSDGPCFSRAHGINAFLRISRHSVGHIK